MVNEADKELNQEELYDLIDNLRDRLREIRLGLTATELPAPHVLGTLGSFARYPQDWEAGKLLQRELGSEAVPYKHESEMGAGFWVRLNRSTQATGS